MAETSNEHIEVTVEPEQDPVVRWLQIGILLVVITALVGAVYLLLVGVINPRAPRTALEAQLVTVREATRLYPDSGKVWGDYVTALMGVGDYTEATRVFEDAQSVLQGEDLLVLQAAGVDLLIAKGEYEEALELAEENIELQAQERERAVRAGMERGIQVDPTLYGAEVSTDVFLGHARAAAGLGEWDLVVESLTSALEFSPRAADLFYMRGDAYSRLGDTEAAAADFKEALRFNPDFPAARDALEKVGDQ